MNPEQEQPVEEGGFDLRPDSPHSQGSASSSTPMSPTSPLYKKTRLFPRQLFITTEQLKTVLGKVVLIDARHGTDPAYGPREHEKLRPAGSVLVNLGEHFRDVDLAKSGAVKFELPPIEKFVAYCERMGFGRKPCVVFGATYKGNADRAAWMLDDLGVETYRLDGGCGAYFADPSLPTESGPVDFSTTTAGEPYAPGTWPFIKRRWKYTCTADELQKAAIVFDTRSPARFGSTIRPAANGDAQAGHIPGAVNMPFTELLTGDPADATTRLKPDAELTATIQKFVGDVPLNECVFSCGQGVTACVSLSAVRQLLCSDSNLRCHPLIYVGSWSEFANAKKDVVIAHYIKEQGFATRFEKTCHGAPLLSAKTDAEEGSGSDSESATGSPVTIDGTRYKNIAAALAAHKNNEHLAKVLPVLCVGDVLQVYTEEKVFAVECK